MMLDSVQVPIPVHGIMKNLPKLSQCQLCQDVPYSYPTKSLDVLNCKAKGGFIAIAAKKQKDELLAVVAGLYSLQLQETYSISRATGPINGAFWYYMPGKSFGFANSTSIFLDAADKGEFRLTNDTDIGCAERLSWHLDAGVGGWRAGCQTGLNDDEGWFRWRKVMYSCNSQVRHVFTCRSTWCTKPLTPVLLMSVDAYTFTNNSFTNNS
jgi:hypothetical protein